MKKKARHNIIAIVYDFDGTLSPNNMQEDTIFRSYGIDKDAFWKKSNGLVEQGYERTLAYLKLLITDPAFQKKPLNPEFLKSLAKDIVFYPGVSGYFEEINRFIAALPEAEEWGIELEHYIVSSGMKEILDGIDLMKYFKKVYACEYAYENNRPVFPKLVINDTNKTQFLFRINKGKLSLAEDINIHMPKEDRRIPFPNMIYIGDSVTDIPSMTVTHQFGGHSVAVFNPKESLSLKIRDMVKKKRVAHFAPADFRSNSLLMKILRLTLNKIVHQIAYDASSQMSFEWVLKHRD